MAESFFGPRRGEIAVPRASRGNPRCEGDMHVCARQPTGGAPRPGVRRGFLEEATSDSGAS